MSFTLLGILNAQAEAAGGGAAYELLETTVLTSFASSVSFTGLDAYTNYKHLQIRYVYKRNSGSGPFEIRFNGETTSQATMSQHFLEGNGTDQFVQSGGQGYNSDGDVVAYSNEDNFSPAVTDILDFANTSRKKTVRTFFGAEYQGNDYISLRSNNWDNTNAITQISFLNRNSRFFVTGSRFSLYGIKG